VSLKALLLLLLPACGGRIAALPDAGPDAGPEAGPASDEPVLPPWCADAGTPPTTLECTGLYADFATQKLAPAARPYAPAVPLWSDGATKARWIELPKGKTIDATDPNEWTFPVGTKVFKEFSYGGKRVETRMFQKVAPNDWVHATYAWNADDSATQISYGQTVPVPDGGTWVIPTPQNCDSCHEGRSDRILGFDEVNLGLAGATGQTLAGLLAEALVVPAPARAELAIGDDGTGLDAHALGWLHTNCGVTCHNANEGAQGFGAGMLLRLDPRWLDGSPPDSTWDPLRTTLSVPCTSGSVAGQPRIEPGNPAGSVIVEVIGTRGALQMPPAPLSRAVDIPDVDSITAWIAHMPHAAGEDGGTGVPPSDAGAPLDAESSADASPKVDGGAVAEASVPDASSGGDAPGSPGDATLEDGSVADSAGSPGHGADASAD
jgi:hypothetical protein